jgi:hypothetical protein
VTRYAVSSSVPITSVNCRSLDLPIQRCDTRAVVVARNPSRAGRQRLTIDAYDLAGTKVRVLRSIVEPTSITEARGFDEHWTVKRRGVERASARRAGATIYLSHLRGNRLQLVTTTGPGRGTLEARARREVIGRAVLSRRPAGRRTLVTIARSAHLPPTIRLRVVSSGRPVTVYGYATTSSAR